MSKELGQLAYEAAFRASPLMDYGPWSMQDDEDKAAWATVESTIRADERAKTIEECAQLCEVGVDMQHPIIGSHTMKAFHKSPALAAAIRALGEKHG